MRVLLAIERGKGIWNVILEMVPRTDCAASLSVPRYDAANVRISNERHSASTMTRPGRASWIIGYQFVKARLVSPPQHSDPAMNLTYRNSKKGITLSVIATAIGAPTNPQPKCCTMIS